MEMIHHTFIRNRHYSKQPQILILAFIQPIILGLADQYPHAVVLQHMYPSQVERLNAYISAKSTSRARIRGSIPGSASYLGLTKRREPQISSSLIASLTPLFDGYGPATRSSNGFSMSGALGALKTQLLPR